jgi:ABC-type spermidine/putrescine transport system permease subunit I
MVKIVDLMQRHRKWLFLSPMAVLLIGFFIIPMIWLFRVSFYLNEEASGFGVGSVRFYVPGTFTFHNYVRILTDEYFLNIILTTLKIGLLTTVVTMVLGYPFAYYIYRAKGFVKGMLLGSVVLPKLMNMLVLFYGLQIILGTSGFINQFLLYAGIVNAPLQLTHNYFAVVLGKTLLILPYTVLVITATLHGIDNSLVDAARGMGASRFMAFLEVTFPLSLPGTMIGLLITIIWGLGAFVSPYLLGNPDLYTMAVEVQRQTFQNVNWAMGSSRAFTMLFMILILVFFYNRFEKRKEARWSAD